MSPAIQRTINAFQGKKALLKLSMKMLSVTSCRHIGMVASLSESHEMLRKTCRDFAEGELKPTAHIWDKEHRFPDTLIRQMGQLGLMAIAVPEEKVSTLYSPL